MIPDWIPNIHPLIVHFPIALLVLAVLFDAARLIFKAENWLEKATLALYATGTLGLIASFLSGRQAVETVSITGDAIPVVASHEDWALYTLVYFLVFTGIRFVTWWNQLEKGFMLPVLVFFAIGGTGMLWYTGELGAKLVYKHGVAVGEIGRLQQRIENLERDLSALREESGPVVEANGSWIWRMAPGSDQVIQERFRVEGSDQFTAQIDREDGIHHLTITASGQIYLLLGESLRSIDGRAEINTDDFDGKFALVHHYQNPDTYQYLRLIGSQLGQGQMRNGSDNLLGSGSVATNGWFTLRVTASGQHYYGFQNGRTIVHTHDDEMQPGITGIAISGEGTLKIRLIEFRNVH